MDDVIIAKRVKKRSGPVALLSYLIHNLGGPKKAAEHLSKALDEPITKDRLILWRLRGAVSFPFLKRVSDALGVSPYCLNYKAYSQFTGEEVGWNEVVMKCPKLSPIQKRDVLAKKLPR